MTSVGSPGRIDRTAGGAAIAAGVCWLAIAGLVGVTIRFRVPNPAELLVDVSTRQVPWMAANVVLIVMPLVLALARPALLGVGAKPWWWEASGPALLAVAGGALAASGVFHGVLGAHLAARVDGRGASQLDVELVRLGELTHALGDTCWFIGVAALMGVTAGSVYRGGIPWMRWCGALSVLANLLQFGWFFDHSFGLVAGPGTLLQALWLAGCGRPGRLQPDCSHPGR